MPGRSPGRRSDPRQGLPRRRIEGRGTSSDGPSRTDERERLQQRRRQVLVARTLEQDIWAARRRCAQPASRPASRNSRTSVRRRGHRASASRRNASRRASACFVASATEASMSAIRTISASRWTRNASSSARSAEASSSASHFHAGVLEEERPTTGAPDRLEATADPADRYVGS